MQVNRVATMSVAAASADETVRSIANRMGQEEVGFMPILDFGKLVGIITDRDIALRVVGAGLDPEKLYAQDVMTKEVFWIFKDAELDDAMRVMADKAVRRLIVMDRQMHPVGVLSLDDIAIFTHGDSTAGRLLHDIAVKSPALAVFHAL